MKDFPPLQSPPLLVADEVWYICEIHGEFKPPICPCCGKEATGRIESFKPPDAMKERK